MTTSKVQSSNLRCKNNCGFYGNPSWDGYCSVCYRETYIQQGLSRNVTTNLPAASTQAFSKFEAKRKQLAGKGTNTLKNIFRFTKDGSRDKTTALPEECYQAASEFNAFLGTLKAAVSADISRLVIVNNLLWYLSRLQVTKQLEELETMGGSHINQYSVVIQKFYQKVSERIAKSPLYSGLGTTMTEKLMDAIEKFLTTWIHDWLFASPITDDETVDLKLQEKIRSLHWITPSLLDSPIDVKCPSEMASLEAATLALIQVNALYASVDKLNEIVRCCLHVFDSLKRHYQRTKKPNTSYGNSSPSRFEIPTSGPSEVVPLSSADSSCEATANADDFLPTLIWVVLSANPPRLHSNLQFIMRFANQTRLNSGQAGYFFTNLSCAVHFITNLTHQSLNLTELEFYRCMRTGRPLIRRNGPQFEGEQLLIDSEIRLLDLQDKVDEFDTKLATLERDQKDFGDCLQQKLQSVRATYSLSSIADKLDPRHLENPHVLILGPAYAQTSSTQSQVSSENTAEMPSLLDMDFDDSVNQFLPQPIIPLPYHTDLNGTSTASITNDG
ncbi:Rab gdp gtp exchange factor [Paragonimus heterotremus]|uniref:Rab gdp gtp exchange factor n=1 Tax=Paragonimus heterotremus TaxID=100268 RepID=A0A8J4SKT8_9TREM|nr:Rab gdp gtp exchange factor [Paragonimus heterotremus]